jgi:fermentation-respiration switch protein FrsA (DUF1100 family)
MSSPAKKPRRSKWTLVWRIVRLPLAAYLVVVLLAMWFENSLIFIPFQYPAGDWRPEELEYEDAEFQAADGTKLHGWFVPAEKPSAVVLFCHGNAGNVTHRVDLMQAMQRYVGATVLVFDYRGYGRSDGSPNEQGVLRDARAARKWLAERTGVAEKDIVLMGESLGGGVAVDLAARDGAKGLVLEDTFTSLPDMAAYHYWWLPAKLLMRSKLDSLSNIGSYHGPLLMCHGEADTIVPIAFAKRLFAAANKPKKFIVQPGADHNDPRSGEFYDALKEFLESTRSD